MVGKPKVSFITFDVTVLRVDNDIAVEAPDTVLEIKFRGPALVRLYPDVPLREPQAP